MKIDGFCVLRKRWWPCALHKQEKKHKSPGGLFHMTRIGIDFYHKNEQHTHMPLI